MISLTAEQRRAVRSTGHKILVEAGAGSGKTRVLVERIAFLMEERGVSPDRILALTFTDQASCEMKSRLSQRLGQELHSILTFHRFCGRLLRENPLLAHVDPDFCMLEGTRSKQVLRSLLLRHLRGLEDRELERRLGQVGTEEFLRVVLALYEKEQHMPPTHHSLLARTEKRLQSLRTEQWNMWRETMKQLTALHESQCITAAGTRRRLHEMVTVWGQLSEVLLELGPSGWDEQEVEQVHAAAELLFQQVSGNVAQVVKPFFAQLSRLKKDRLWEDLLLDRTQGLRVSLCQLLSDLDALYRQEKYAHGWCDFHDLEQRAYRLLVEHPDVRQRYSRLYTHILVDEYQDTNPVQQAILELLKSEPMGEGGSLFMVGDPRQSIYRFRGADVRGFTAVKKGLQLEDEWVVLRENFRMSESLCAWTEEVCGQLFEAQGESVGGVEGEVVAELLLPELELGEFKQERAADLVARRILQFGPVHYGDVAVLLQTRTHQSVYVQALRRYGIPFVLEEDAGFWKRQEVQDLMHVLETLVDPGNSLALLGYLRCPLVRWPDHLLWKVAQAGGLSIGFAAEGEHFSSQELELVRMARSQLARWRQELEQQSVTDWLYGWLYGQGVEAALGGGSLQKFVDWAQEAESTGVVDLAGLVQGWRQMEATEERVSVKAGPTEGSRGCVRVMTIHAAKGLEFPVVCLPDLTHPHTLRMDSLHVSEEYGVVVKGEESRSLYPTLAYQAAMEMEKEAQLEEKKRLLYVGLTRAKERVVLSGAAMSFRERESLAACTNWWDWLPHLVKGLAVGEVEEQVVRGRGWKMLVVRDSSVPVVEMGSVVESRDVGVAEEVGVNGCGQEAILDVGGLEGSKRIWSVTELVRRGDVEWASGLGDVLSSRGSEVWWRHSRSGSADLLPHEWGQVVHALLERLRPADTEEIVREVRLPVALAACGFTGMYRVQEVWERVRDSVQRYRESELFQEYVNASVRYHELPFVLEWMPGVSVQGVIDVLWKGEDGKATVVDFKTQVCRNEREMREAAKRYAPQVSLYALVAERLLGWSVDRVGVYFTESGQFWPVEFRCEEVQVWADRVMREAM